MNLAVPNTVLTPAVEAKESGRVPLAQTLCWIVLATVAFYMAYWSPTLSYGILVYLFALVQVSRGGTVRRAFYAGLIVGLLIAAGWLAFFWRIFSFGAVALWLVYAFWIGFFTALARLCWLRFPSKWAWLCLPVLWCGLEYFRSELYYLRFSWLTPGLAFGTNVASLLFAQPGSYGIGFFLVGIACLATFVWQDSKWAAFAVLTGGVVALQVAGRASQLRPNKAQPTTLRVAAVQLEFPTEKQVCTWLSQLVSQHPEADLLVLSEYTFEEPPPLSVLDWCRQHNRYLIVGGKDHASNSPAFYDTAFVISPAGQVVFRQYKAVPIQFFNDGLPAPQQRIWESPWGKLGICICYDLSYSRVTDRLIAQGAQALIVPTMDVEDWGKRQHELHARIAPVRAAEYRVPVFRVASSGISQAVNSSGRVLASAPCPGQGAMIAATLPLNGTGRLPLDRWLAPVSSALSAMIFLITLLGRISHASRGTASHRSGVSGERRCYSLGRMRRSPETPLRSYETFEPGRKITRPHLLGSKC